MRESVSSIAARMSLSFVPSHAYERTDVVRANRPDTSTSSRFATIMQLSTSDKPVEPVSVQMLHGPPMHTSTTGSASVPA